MSTRRALASCGTRQMSASVGASPWQNVPVAASRDELRLQRFETDIDPVPVPAVLLRLRRRPACRSGSCSTRRLLSGWMSQAMASAMRAHARAPGGVRRQQRRLTGYVSSRYSMIASDCVSTSPSSVDERRHEALRIAARDSRRARCAPLRRWTNARSGDDALQVERDANAVGGGRAEIVVELHARSSLRQNAEMPVCARPRISAWTSCVPS